MELVVAILINVMDSSNTNLLKFIKNTCLYDIIIIGYDRLLKLLR